MAGELPVMTLDPDLERLLQGSIGSANSPATGLEPSLAERLQSRLAESAQRQERSASQRCCWCRRRCAQTLARFIRASVPNMHVLAWNEIPDNRKVRLVSAVGR